MAQLEKSVVYIEHPWINRGLLGDDMFLIIGNLDPWGHKATAVHVRTFAWFDKECERETYTLLIPIATGSCRLALFLRLENPPCLCWQGAARPLCCGTLSARLRGYFESTVVCKLSFKNNGMVSLWLNANYIKMWRSEMTIDVRTNCSIGVFSKMLTVQRVDWSMNSK